MVPLLSVYEMLALPLLAVSPVAGTLAGCAPLALEK